MSEHKCKCGNEEKVQHKSGSCGNKPEEQSKDQNQSEKHAGCGEHKHGESGCGCGHTKK